MGGADKKRGEERSATKPQRVSGIAVRRDFLLNNTLRYCLSIKEIRKEKQNILRSTVIQKGKQKVERGKVYRLYQVTFNGVERFSSFTSSDLSLRKRSLLYGLSEQGANYR